MLRFISDLHLAGAAYSSKQVAPRKPVVGDVPRFIAGLMAGVQGL